MTIGRLDAEWDRTSLLASLIFNANKAESEPARGPNDFHPMKSRDVQTNEVKLSPEESMKLLGGMFKMARKAA